MYYNPFNRRQFLVGLSSGVSTALALPLLTSLLPKSALANSGNTPNNRFIAIWGGLGGQNASDVYPNYLADQSFLAYPGLGHHFYHTNLRKSDNKNSISNIYSQALNPFMSKLNVIAGLDCPVTANHGDHTFLGHFYELRGGDFVKGMPNAASIDQFLAYHDKVYPSTPTIRSLTCNGNTFKFKNRYDVNSGISKVPSVSNASVAFDLLFGVGESLSAKGTTLVDQTINDLKKIKNSTKISSKDKAKLSNWTDEMHELQQKIIKIKEQASSCASPNQPQKPTSEFSSLSDEERATHFDLLTSVLAAGIKCGQTKISTIGAGITKGAQGANYHHWGHNGDRGKIADVMRWQVENILVPLLAKLDVEESNGKTYLDNSIVVYGNISSNVHTLYNRPILTAGSGGGFFNTGQYLDYRQRHRYQDWTTTKNANFHTTSQNGGHPLIPGVFYNQFLCSIMQSMGLSESDYNVFAGHKGYSGVRYGTSGITHGKTKKVAHFKEHADDAGKPLKLLVKDT